MIRSHRSPHVQFVLQGTQPAKAATFCTKVQLARIARLPYSRYRDRRCARPQWEHIMNESPQVPIIAVVDDDESVRESLAGLAETVGYEATLFASAEDFLKSVHHHDSLACLILDVRLPGMSGVELYTQLPVTLRSIPTIFITA